MRKIILSIVCVWLFPMSNALAYDITSKDRNTIVYVENRLVEIINKRWKKMLSPILDKIDSIQMLTENERLLTLYKELEWNLAQRYSVDLYSIAIWNTPLLNNSNFQWQFGWTDWLTLNFDSFGEIYALEHIALSWSVIRIQDMLTHAIYSVDTKEYPAASTLYAHESFIPNISYRKPTERVKNLPSVNEIVENLQSSVWVDYVWWGNTIDGIPSLLEIFPPSVPISEKKKAQWTLTWLDCSWLIYWASGGYTPRNTSWLVDYGNTLPIAWKDVDEIISLLKPLDIIVWKWHMMIVLNDTQTIESAVSFTDIDVTPGVQIRESIDSISEVMMTRRPSNNYWETDKKEFVIIRWYPEL